MFKIVFEDDMMKKNIAQNKIRWFGSPKSLVSFKVKMLIPFYDSTSKVLEFTTSIPHSIGIYL